MILTLAIKFNIEEIVYLKTDPNQYPRMVTSFKYNGECVYYELSSGTIYSWHIAGEISRTKDIALTTTN